MNELKNKLLLIIFDELKCHPDDKDSFDIFEEEIEKIAAEYGYSELILASLEILKNQSQSKCWYLAACVISWFVEDKVSLPCKWVYLVAVLYVCLERVPVLDVSGPADGENLVWSIASTVAGVGYMSDWEPLKDKEVVKRMKLIKEEQVNSNNKIL
ncbi:MAG: hypothetical protein GY714_28080 [Desulfobacterales bacterium]|nr:hypothetical protein [Desulfobacterales bacterium]MCP4159359.1 hypothetical protein [Deltaproteobacteria bacterium]